MNVLSRGGLHHSRGELAAEGRSLSWKHLPSKLNASRGKQRHNPSFKEIVSLFVCGEITTMQSLASRRASIYERALAAKVQREEKLQALRERQFQHECTFTPKTSKSFGTAGTAGTSGGSFASNNSILQSVSPVQHTAEVQSRAESAEVSSRFEDLYHREVMKLRMKPKTSTEERFFRDKLYEERELEECTFHPDVLHRGRQDPPEAGVFRARRRLITTPYRFHPRMPAQPPVPDEIMFSVDEVDLNSVIHPFEANQCRPRLEDMAQSLQCNKEQSSPRKCRRPKPGRIKRRKRSRRRRPPPDVGSI